jgi:lipoate-protein ligase A
MHWAELPAGDPPEVLAWEEAFLDSVEAGGESVLWFWESRKVFVVVGYGQSIAREVHKEQCQARKITILRRSSGGGAVVQGPGCLNYGLALHMADDPQLASVTKTNRWIMGRHACALNRLLQGRVSVQGHTDLAVSDEGGVLQKCSGNAQRRTRNAVLFHGTFLHHFDVGLVAELLPPPSAQPAYRAERSHADFIANLNCPPDSIRAVLRSEWNASKPVSEWPHAWYKQALSQRYHRSEWHDRR